MQPSFCVITTTYKRTNTVLRCVESVQKQTYTNWQQLVVIDDTDSDYSALEALAVTSPSLTILKNQNNLGKNASVNRAFAHLRRQNFSGYIVFLDDDDWLSPSCLNHFANILKKFHYPWLVSNRAIANTEKSLTKNNTDKDTISYQYHCLLKKDFSGDATHCLYFPNIQNVNFPLLIKNAEEWLYFAHVSTIHPQFKYIPTTGTLSEGYSTAGLTDLYHQNQEKTKNAFPLLKEVWRRRIFSPLILSYVLLRLVRSLF